MKRLTAADPVLLALLEEVRSCPTEPLPLLALADYLSEQAPTPVNLGHVPDWLRQAWMKARRGDADHRWRGLTSGWAVLTDLGEWLSGQSATHYWRLDHAGSTVVGGLEGFATEPYGSLEVAREQARCLAGKVGCVGVGLAEGRWGRGTVRVLLLPPPEGTEACDG
jgi:hypothetical protein